MKGSKNVSKLKSLHNLLYQNYFEKEIWIMQNKTSTVLLEKITEYWSV